MKTSSALFVAGALLGCCTGSYADSRGCLNTPGKNELAAINRLLSNYTASVFHGDRTAFEAQLLDASIPFSYVPQGAAGGNGPNRADFRDYADFRRAIFESGRKYRQRFRNIEIKQLGNLAQVSLDYQTSIQGEPFRGSGWKVLQLVKVNGRWLIASELYTAYPGAASRISSATGAPRKVSVSLIHRDGPVAFRMLSHRRQVASG